MLRRSNSKSSNRLSRRKSTSSIHSKQAHIDPELARQQARVAAMHAFARAYERDSADKGRSGEVSRNSNKLDQRPMPSQDNETEQRDRGVRRQQSVRFTGPEATPRRGSIGRRALQGSLEDKAAVATSLRPRALTNNAPVPAAYRPPSRSSSIGKASIGKGTAQSIVTALAAYDEYYTREDDIASTPSSYRRIRKSKSARTLCSPTKVGSAGVNKVKTGNHYSTRTWDQVPWITCKQHESVLRAPKSMSFLRGGRDHMTPAVRQDHDKAVQMARDKFLHQIEQQRLREQPSFLFRAKERKGEKPFRQSIRSGSTNSYDIPLGSINQISQSKHSSLQIKARRASQTIKKKLKEFFRRGGGQVEEVKIPNQQVEARTSHGIGNLVAVSRAGCEEFLDIPYPDDATASRVASRVPSLDTVHSNQHLKSRNSSVRSQRSDGSEQSRDTSAADNIATARHLQTEKEAQRLSIIQENGTHVSSASFSRSGLSNQFSAYPILHRSHSANSRGLPPSGLADSQKAYSALVKLLDENSPITKLDARRTLSSARSGPEGHIPPRTTSMSSYYRSHANRAPATIRRVHEDAAEWTDKKQRDGNIVTPLPQEEDDVFSPKPSGRDGSSMHIQLTSRVPSYLELPSLNASEGFLIPPQQLAARNEPLIKTQKVLRETRSTFFGNSSYTVHRNTSPYRRALAEADYNTVVATGEAPRGPSPNRMLFAPPIVHCSDPKEAAKEEPIAVDEAYAESVYSRTTSGRTPAAKSSQLLAPVESGPRIKEKDSVDQTDHRTYRHRGLKSKRRSASESSGWKDWLTVEASMIETPHDTDGVARINYALQPMPKPLGHFREHAQITEDETEILQRKVSIPRQPMAILQQKMSQTAELKPILKHKSSLSLDTFPIPPPLPPPPPPPPPLPPQVPLRSPLRLTKSRNSLSSIDSTIMYRTLSAPSSAAKHAPPINHPLLRPRSLTNINQAYTPAKLIKRSKRPSDNHDPSPGIGAAVEREFGSTGSRTPYSRSENCGPVEAARIEHYSSNQSCQKEMTDSDGQAMGRGVMVDMFLSSRRRRLAGSDESNAFL